MKKTVIILSQEEIDKSLSVKTHLRFARDHSHVAIDKLIIAKQEIKYCREVDAEISYKLILNIIEEALNECFSARSKVTDVVEFLNDVGG